MEKKSNNPFLSSKAFTQPASVHNAEGHPASFIDYNNTMTIQGAVNKSFILLLLLVASSLGAWIMTATGSNPMVLAIAGAVIGFILVMVTVARPHTSAYLAPAYALFEGLFIGSISAVFEVMYPGIVLEAVGATFITFIICFLLYKFRVVKVTEQFKSVVIASTLAIATYYFVSIILSMFGIHLFHHDNSLMSIGFSIFVIVIASLNLFLDFDMIEQGAQKSLPKYMEWFCAMGLIITLVWLYIEFLRLLSKLRD